MTIYDLMSRGQFLLSDSGNKREAILEMVESAAIAGFVKEKSELEKSILERESIVSTGLGLGVAVPHTRLSSVSSFFVVTAVFKSPIDWDSIDKKPVKAAFMIVGPEKEQKQYLELLAKLILLVKNQARRDCLFSAQNKGDVLKTFERF